MSGSELLGPDGEVLSREDQVADDVVYGWVIFAFDTHEPEEDDGDPEYTFTIRGFTTEESDLENEDWYAQCCRAVQAEVMLVVADQLVVGFTRDGAMLYQAMFEVMAGGPVSTMFLGLAEVPDFIADYHPEWIRAPDDTGDPDPNQDQDQDQDPTEEPA